MRATLKTQIAKLKRMQSNIYKGDTFLKEVQKLNELVLNSSENEKIEANKLLIELMNNGLSIIQSAVEKLKFNETATIINTNNKSYDLRNWATITQYAKLFGYKNIQSVSNKIARGKIHSSDIIYIPDLDLKLIRLP